MYYLFGTLVSHYGSASLNHGQRKGNVSPLLELRSQAVDEATQHIDAANAEYNQRIDPILQQQLDRLEHLKWEHNRQLELQFENTNSLTKSKKEKAQNRIERIFDDYYTWVEESTITEKAPYIKIVAVLSGSG